MAGSGISNSNVAPDSAIASGFRLALDEDGGIELSKLKPGTVLEVQTKNTVYTVIPQASGEALIWGHPDYCPEPTTVKGLGAAYITGYFRDGYLAPGMRISFPSDGRRVATSRIVSITPRSRH